MIKSGLLLPENLLMLLLLHGRVLMRLTRLFQPILTSLFFGSRSSRRREFTGLSSKGGDRPNIIPQSATVDYYIRSESVKSLKPLTEKVVKCFEAAAMATGCEVEFNWYTCLSVSLRRVRI